MFLTIHCKPCCYRDPPVFDDDNDYDNLFELLYDSLPLTRRMFPNLLQLSSIETYKAPVNNLLATLVDSGFLHANDYESYFSRIYFDAKIEMKKMQNNDERLLQNENNEDDDDAVTTVSSPYHFFLTIVIIVIPMIIWLFIPLCLCLFTIRNHLFRYSFKNNWHLKNPGCAAGCSDCFNQAQKACSRQYMAKPCKKKINTEFCY